MEEYCPHGEFWQWCHICELCPLCDMPVENCKCINGGNVEIVVGENMYNVDVEEYNITITDGPLHDLYGNNVLSFHTFDKPTHDCIKSAIESINICLTDPDKYLDMHVFNAPIGTDNHTKKIFCILSYWSQNVFHDGDLYDLITKKRDHTITVCTEYCYDIMMFINGIYHMINVSIHGGINSLSTCNEIGLEDNRYVDTITELIKTTPIDDIPRIIAIRNVKRAQ